MVNIHIPGRSNLSNWDHYRKMQTMGHLHAANKDVNYWEFNRLYPPEWAPPSCDHVFQARDKKTGITQEWLIDKSQASDDGNFTPEHNRIRESFAAALLELDHLAKKARSRMAIGQKGIVLADSEPNFDILARAALWRGDHDNSYESL